MAQLHRRRDVLRMLVARDLKRKYAISYLGYVWTLLEPALLILVYWLVWGHVARLGIQNYVVFIAAGVLPFPRFPGSRRAPPHVVFPHPPVVSSVSIPPGEVPPFPVIKKAGEVV